MIALLFAVFFIGSVCCDGSHDPVYTLFGHYDGRDHRMSHSEFNEIFYDMMSHNTGALSLTRAEFDAGWRNAHLSSNQDVDYLFTVADIDGDGRITTTDTQYLFNLIDTDGDGMLDQNGFRSGWNNIFTL